MTYSKPYNPMSIRPNKIIIAGTCVLQDGQPPIGLYSPTQSGDGYILSRDGVGEYRITLTDSFSQVDYLSVAAFSAASGTDFAHAEIVNVTDAVPGEEFAFMQVNVYSVSGGGFTLTDASDVGFTFMFYFTI